MTRRIVLLSHKWAALITGVFLAVVGLTGAILAFDDEIAHATYGGMMRLQTSPIQVPLDVQLSVVQQTFPGQPIFGLRLGAADRATTFFAGPRQVMVNGHTGEVTGTRSPADFLRIVHRLHESLFLGPPGKIAVAASALTLLLLSASGIVLWWRDRRLRIRGRFVARDTHHSVGIASDAYLFALAVTALFMALPLTPLIFMLTGSKTPSRQELSSTVVKGAPPVAIDRVVGMARVALPDLTPEVVLLPRGPSGSFRVGMRLGEEASLAGDVQIDQYSGIVLSADRVDNADAAMRIVLGMRAFHTGRWLGIPTQILGALAGLAMLAQAITGFVMWRRPVRAAYRVPAPAAIASLR